MSNIPQSYFPTKYWHILENGRVQCDVCPHRCKLLEKQRGLCFVRMRHNDQIVLTTYGRSSGFCVDPIEKKPLYHFLPGTPVFSFGTIGCNLACRFCQNWDISRAKDDKALSDAGMPDAIAQTAERLNCKSVAFTYNEPIVFLEYAVDVAKACRKKGIKTIAVTNGYILPEPAKEFFGVMDAANVDLKGFTEEFYRKITGSHLQPVLDTLVYLKHKSDVWLEITSLLIPGENDSEEEIDDSTKWIAKNLGVDIPLHFSAFFPAWKMMNVPPTPKETLVRARQIAIKNGLRYVYLGNVYDVEGSNTYCHSCGRAIIERVDYEITTYALTDQGCCKFCGTKCNGIFEESCGSWGNKRQPVLLKG